MKKNPNIQTDYGEVKEKSLEALRDSYDTAQLIRAVDHIDTVRHHIDSIRENMLKLHTASMDLIATRMMSLIHHLKWGVILLDLHMS